MQGLRDDFFTSAVLSSDENIGVGRSDARNQLKDRLHGCGFGDQSGARFGAKQAILRFETRSMAQSLPKIDLSTQDAQEPGVFPGLLQKVACATTHCFNSDFYAAPGSHHDDGKTTVNHLDSAEEIQSFLPRGSISSVVQVHQYSIEFAVLDCGKSFGGRSGGLRFIAFVL